MRSIFLAASLTAHACDLSKGRMAAQRRARARRADGVCPLRAGPYAIVNVYVMNDPVWTRSTYARPSILA